MQRNKASVRVVRSGAKKKTSRSNCLASSDSHYMASTALVKETGAILRAHDLFSNKGNLLPFKMRPVNWSLPALEVQPSRPGIRCLCSTWWARPAHLASYLSRWEDHSLWISVTIISSTLIQENAERLGVADKMSRQKNWMLSQVL